MNALMPAILRDEGRWRCERIGERERVVREGGACGAFDTGGRRECVENNEYSHALPYSGGKA